MKSVSSRDNSVYKDVKRLATSSHARRQGGRTLLDGVHLCESYLQHVGFPLLCIISETSLSHPEVLSILARCEEKRTQCLFLSESLYRAVSQVENGIDLLFVIDIPETTMPEVLSQSAVLLDHLQDPGNLGSILRSAAAAGITHVFCSNGTAFTWSPKVLRAGMGAHFLLNIVENVDLVRLVQSCSVPILATSSHASRLIYEMDLSGPVAWLFGHEGQGVSEALLALATHQVVIPHLGAIESLNVAASAAVCFFEQTRQKLERRSVNQLDMT
jgi:RNA methyltransferase, TrmH family